MQTEDILGGMEDDADGEWYQSDLQLAAELGKALLERNRELETHILQIQQASQDQHLENEYLNKQLETLRETSDARMRVYEELDKNAQELEKQNQRLIIDSRGEKQRIEKLTDTVDTMENKCDELQKKIDELKTERKREHKQQKQESRRAVSCVNLRENTDYIKNLYNGEIHWTYTDQFKNLPLNPYEVEIKSLQETIKQLKAQQLIERRKREDVETEVKLLWEENESLEAKVKDLDKKVKITEGLEEELQKVKLNAGKVCHLCGKSLEKVVQKSALEAEVEHDEPEVKHTGKLMRLGGGGSVYGSTESVSKIAPDSQPISPEEPDSHSVSILNELENQYQNLFEKYEDLLQGRKRSSFHEYEGTEETFDEALNRHLAVSHKEVQTLLKLQKQTCDTASGGATCADELGSPPEYKILFRDIFATLKKSRIEEGGEQMTSSHSTPATSPVN
ncbi:cerebellar degeneration-related protein 2-like [Mizuhopecten yessoensis]|uniref:Cerebellar degeneration-related protein 2 n=1 Tax=Mizuhopecten yessoensis TaxID=6573 RepID=A0A210R4N5_MIZYE|nr:cerebellar degeneration-related protein 2-like [Mizuhopecten yessoensis]OWF55979.1 Cerebellar degeneration-related protein 2 [Mizuhopecten yessoensis]